MKKLITILILFVSPVALKAGQFTDVPRSHWAYDSIQKMVDADVCYSCEGMYHGKRKIARYQMADWIRKILWKVSQMYAPPGTAGQMRHIMVLEGRVIGLADTLADLKNRVKELESKVDALKGSPPPPEKSKE